MMQMKIVCLCFLAAVVFYPSLGYKDAKGRIRYVESRLMMEYNWPTIKKDLKRLPHIISCDHFYAARPDGTHDIKKCPDEQSFDFKTLQCKEKSQAKCWSKEFKTDYTKKNEFVCPFAWGQYPNINDCSSFYSCLNGLSSQRKCPQSFLFDKVSRKCVNEAAAMCADQRDIIEPGYQCPYTWGFFTHSKDCAKYYECLQNNPSLKTCKTDMLFDNLKRTCRHKSKVNCGARFNPYELNKHSSTGSTDKVGFSDIATSHKEIYPTFKSTGKDQVTDTALKNKGKYSTVQSTLNKEPTKVAFTDKSTVNEEPTIVSIRDKEQREETMKSEQEYSTIESTNKGVFSDIATSDKRIYATFKPPTEKEEIEIVSRNKVHSTVEETLNKELTKVVYTVESTLNEESAKVMSTIESIKNEEPREKTSKSKQEYSTIGSTNKGVFFNISTSHEGIHSTIEKDKEVYSTVEPTVN